MQISSRITEFSTIPHYSVTFFGKKLSFFDSGDIIPVRLAVMNVGDNLIKPQGTITFHGPFQSSVPYSILPQNILAHSERLLTATPSATIVCTGNNAYACKYPHSLLIPGFFIGSYKISTEISFGENTPNLFNNVTIYVLPIKYAIGIIILIIIAIIVIKKLKDDN
jgi:hypothetical protein